MVINFQGVFQEIDGSTDLDCVLIMSTANHFFKALILFHFFIPQKLVMTVTSVQHTKLAAQ